MVHPGPLLSLIPDPIPKSRIYFKSSRRSHLRAKNSLFLRYVDMKNVHPVEHFGAEAFDIFRSSQTGNAQSFSFR